MNDIGQKGILSHTGSDKSSFKDRIERYCKWGGGIFESIDYGIKDCAKDVVLSLLVDDGVKKRPNRTNILSKDHKLLGVAAGEHKEA